MSILKNFMKKWKEKRAAKKAIKKLYSPEELKKQEEMNKAFALRNAKAYKEAKELRDKIYKERGYKGDSVIEMIRKDEEIPIQIESREKAPEWVKRFLKNKDIGSRVLAENGIYVKTYTGIGKVRELDEKPSYIQALLDMADKGDLKAIEELIRRASQ